MSGTDYAVDTVAAVVAWIEDEHPPIHQVDAFQQWAKNLESKGPPPVHGYSQNGLSLTLGPSGETVEFDVVVTPLGFGPPHSIIAVKTIRSEH